MCRVLGAFASKGPTFVLCVWAPFPPDLLFFFLISRRLCQQGGGVNGLTDAAGVHRGNWSHPTRDARHRPNEWERARISSSCCLSGNPPFYEHNPPFRPLRFLFSLWLTFFSGCVCICTQFGWAPFLFLELVFRSGRGIRLWVTAPVCPTISFHSPHMYSISGKEKAGSFFSCV